MNISSKIFVCLIGVLGNAGIWGDVSIDTVLSQTYGFKIKPSESKGCSRPCVFGQKPRTCLYDFRVEHSVIRNKSVLAINGMVPGPSIEVCVNDVIIVDVSNRLQGLELALHWRGLSQKGTPFMDGVPMVSQCPIISGTSFRYVFRAEDVGTHFYHAHSVSQQLAGMFGALIIRQPAPLEPASALFGHGSVVGHVLVVSVATVGRRLTDLEVDGLSDKGGELRRVSVIRDNKYRVRMINAIPLNCPLAISTPGHRMVVISSDGRPVKPVTATTFILLPGERFDFLLNADQTGPLYELKIKGLDLCEHLVNRAIISYNESATELDNLINTKEEKEIVLRGQNLKSPSSPPADLIVSPISQKTVYLKVDTSSKKVDDDDNDYRYLSHTMPVPPFYPAELSMDDTQFVQINDKSFLYPNAPILTQPDDITQRLICPVGQEYRTKGVECTQILEVDYKSTLELVIVDEGYGSNTTKVFHLHGNSMYVVTTSKSHTKGITKEDVEEMDSLGKIKRDLWNPPAKDTIYVPNKGYTIVRIIANNPGTWLFECRSCEFSSLPTAIVIKIRSKLPSKVLKNLPKCGNFRPPDTLIH